MVRGTFGKFQGSIAKQKLHLFIKGVKNIIKHEKVEFINEISSKLYYGGIFIYSHIKILSFMGKRRET